MPRYVTLFRWTQQGAEKVKESPSRVVKTKEAAKALGVDIKAVYVTLGHYDTIFVVEAPDDASYARFTWSVISKGNVQCETLRAFTEDEFREIVAGLS